MNAQYRETVKMPDAVKKWLKERHKTLMAVMREATGGIGVLVVESMLIERWFNAMGEELVEPGTQYRETVEMPDAVKKWLKERYKNVMVSMRNLYEKSELVLRSPDGRLYDGINSKHQDIINILASELTLIDLWFNAIEEGAETIKSNKGGMMKEEYVFVLGDDVTPEQLSAVSGGKVVGDSRSIGRVIIEVDVEKLFTREGYALAQAKLDEHFGASVHHLFWQILETDQHGFDVQEKGGEL